MERGDAGSFRLLLVRRRARHRSTLRRDFLRRPARVGGRSFYRIITHERKTCERKKGAEKAPGVVSRGQEASRSSAPPPVDEGRGGQRGAVRRKRSVDVQETPLAWRGAYETKGRRPALWRCKSSPRSFSAAISDASRTVWWRPLALLGLSVWSSVKNGRNARGRVGDSYQALLFCRRRAMLERHLP